MVYGTPITEEKGLYKDWIIVFVSQTLKVIIQTILFSNGQTMLGVGVGFDNERSWWNDEGDKKDRDEQVYEIPDTREGWVESLKLLLKVIFTVI